MNKLVNQLIETLAQYKVGLISKAEYTQITNRLNIELIACESL